MEPSLNTQQLRCRCCRYYEIWGPFSPMRSPMRSLRGLRAWTKGYVGKMQRVKMSWTIEDPNMAVSWNRGTHRSSILSGFSSINHLFWGYPHLWKPPYHSCNFTCLSAIGASFPIGSCVLACRFINIPIPVRQIPCLFCTFAHMVGTTKFYRFSEYAIPILMRSIWVCLRIGFETSNVKIRFSILLNFSQPSNLQSPRYIDHLPTR